MHPSAWKRFAVVLAGMFAPVVQPLYELFQQ